MKSIHGMCRLCQTNYPQLGIKTWSYCCYVCHLHAGHGGGWWVGWKREWFYSRFIPWSHRAEQTAGEGPVMRLPKVQLYNESFFMPDLCIERQVRKAIRERQLSAIFPLQQYRTSVYFHFIPLSHLLSPSLPFFWVSFSPESHVARPSNWLYKFWFTMQLILAKNHLLR